MNRDLGRIGKMAIIDNGLSTATMQVAVSREMDFTAEEETPEFTKVRKD